MCPVWIFVIPNPIFHFIKRSDDWTHRWFMRDFSRKRNIPVLFVLHESVHIETQTLIAVKSFRKPAPFVECLNDSYERRVASVVSKQSHMSFTIMFENTLLSIPSHYYVLNTILFQPYILLYVDSTLIQYEINISWVNRVYFYFLIRFS